MDADVVEDDALEEGDSPDTDTDGIKITVPQEPEVNPEVYADTVRLLERGFLTLSAEIGEVPFIFKSLNHHELELVRLLSGHVVGDVNIPPRFWDLFLAHMVLFVDGQNVLLDRNKYVPKLAATFKELPGSARVLLTRQLSELNRKAAQATLLVEAYAMESYSRWRWAQVYGLDLTSIGVTGLAGTDQLGLTYAQLAWRAINYYEDIRHRQDTEWENAKFIGGCFAGKGIDKIYRKDADRRKKEKEERWSRKDLLIRHVLFGEPLQADQRYDGAQVVMVANTVEELADQVERALKGEKDWHDKVIDSYENSIREDIQRRQAELQQVIQTRKKDMQGKSVVGGTNLAGLSASQVADLIREQEQRVAEGQNQPMGELIGEDSERLRKWGLMDETLPTTDRDTSLAYPVVRRPNGKSWRP